MNGNSCLTKLLVITFALCTNTISVSAQFSDFPQRSTSSNLWWESSRSFTFSDGVKDSSQAQLFYRWKARATKPDGILEYRKSVSSSTQIPYSLQLETDLLGGIATTSYSDFDNVSSKWNVTDYRRITETKQDDFHTEIRVHKTFDSQLAITRNDSLHRQTAPKGWLTEVRYENDPTELISQTNSTILDELTTINESFTRVGSELIKVDSAVSIFDEKERIVRFTRFQVNNDNQVTDLSEFSYFADTTIWKQSFYLSSLDTFSTRLIQRSWNQNSGDTLLSYAQILDINALPDTVVNFLMIEKSIPNADSSISVGTNYYVFDASGSIVAQQVSKTVVDSENRIVSVITTDSDISGNSYISFSLQREFHANGILLHQESKSFQLEGQNPKLTSNLILSNRLDDSESIVDSTFSIDYFKSSGWDSTLTVYSLTNQRPVELENPGEIVTSIETENPTSFNVFENYPNPFNPTTTIRYQIPKAGRIQIVLYSLLGQKLRILENRVKSAGTHSLELNAQSLSSGVYIYRIHFENQIISKKITLQK